MAIPKIKLRLRDNITDDLFRLPVVHTGTMKSCQRYAESKGFVWKPLAAEIYGGYWVEKSTGNCLIPC